MLQPSQEIWWVLIAPFRATYFLFVGGILMPFRLHPYFWSSVTQKTFIDWWMRHFNIGNIDKGGLSLNKILKTNSLCIILASLFLGLRYLVARVGPPAGSCWRLGHSRTAPASWRPNQEPRIYGLPIQMGEVMFHTFITPQQLSLISTQAALSNAKPTGQFF